MKQRCRHRSQANSSSGFCNYLLRPLSSSQSQRTFRLSSHTSPCIWLLLYIEIVNFYLDLHLFRISLHIEFRGTMSTIYILTSPSHKTETRSRRLKSFGTSEMDRHCHQPHSRNPPRKCECCIRSCHKITLIRTSSNEGGEILCSRRLQLNERNHGAAKHNVSIYQRRRLSAILEEPCVQS